MTVMMLTIMIIIVAVISKNCFPMLTVAYIIHH